MSSLVWDFVIIGAVVLIFIILVRRLPVAARFVKEEKKEVEPKKIIQVSLMSAADDAFEAADFVKAEELYIKLAADDPRNDKVYFRLGQIYLEQKNFYDAKDAFLQSIKLAASNPLSQANLGDAYLGLKDYFKATQSYLKAIELEPKEKKYRVLYEKAQKALEREKKRGK
jgi:cytochrome c-type biogenesis protein CcmH/NrfG